MGWAGGELLLISKHVGLGLVNKTTNGICFMFIFTAQLNWMFLTVMTTKHTFVQQVILDVVDDYDPYVS